MARKRIVNRPGFFGTMYHYDERGRFVGKSRPALFGAQRVYTDHHGQFMGVSRSGFFGTQVYTDRDGNVTTTYPGFFGQRHRSGGRPVGVTRPGLFGSSYTIYEEPEEEFFDYGFCEEDEEWE